jgi:hypothetical protein
MKYATAACSLAMGLGLGQPAWGQQIHVAFLWHMHQPIYYPYETIIQTDANNRYSFSVIDVHNQRFGPYTTWPWDAVQAGASLPHLGAHVSFSGSLIENLNNLESAGINGGMWSNWAGGYDQSQSLFTSLGNRRLELVAFGYHHPLMPLLDYEDTVMQIRLHKHVYAQTWAGGATYAKGMFPAETAFSERMIPALVAQGVEWVMVDNIHFDRACASYPHTNASCLFAPNAADQINPDPAANGGAWVQLNNLWAPSKVSAPFGYQPHHVQYVNPGSGAVTQMVAVPAARYEGNEDGRGGYGAFLYDVVMDAYLAYNTDPAHPMLVLLHHDGDNFGGGSEAYYHSNFQNMVNWASADPDYDVSTVDDYLERFPVDANDVIHIEDGSWAGADCGDAEFKKWLGDPNAGGWSPDRNSWAVLTAAKNRVFMAEQVVPAASMQNVLIGAGSNTEKAWHFLLVSEASDYWYWDGSSEPWDSNVTRGCNQAVVFADAVINGQPDITPPTVFVPQREPYNPGGFEWGPSPEPSDFTVWTFAYDVSGLASVTLYWRVDGDGVNPIGSIQNETFAGGLEVGVWNALPMSASPLPPPQNGVIAPTYRADAYSAEIAGQSDVLIDYYVQAIDNAGQVRYSDIQHVYVGLSVPVGGEGVAIDPDPAVAGQMVQVSYDPAGTVLGGAPLVFLHYGFNGWDPVISPDPAMTWNAVEAVWEVTVPVPPSASQLDLVFNNGAGTWDNNNGADWHFSVTGGVVEGPSWEMDGLLDANATFIAASSGMNLHAGVSGDTLYVATPDAGEGNDHFIFLANPPGAPQPHPWAKAGTVAGWSAYLGNENDNGWSGWFGAPASAEVATGGGSGFLEGTINLVEHFGFLPESVYLSVAVYPTGDGSSLVQQSQVPASVNGDGNVDAAEYALIDLCGIQLLFALADLNTDCSINLADMGTFAACLAGPEAAPAAACPVGAIVDLDSDGDADLGDFAAFQRGFAGL